MSRFWLLIASIAAAAALAVAGCGDDDDNGGGGAGGAPIKIGVMNPFSGNFALYGEEVTRGYELAIAEVNENGGIDGRRVELVRGDAMTADQAITQAERLATRENVDIFTGTYISAVSNSASDVAARHGKLYWETNALANELTDRNLDNFLRVGPTANDFADVSAAAMEAVAETLGKDISELRIFIEHEDSIYGTSVAERQAELLREAGAQVVGVNAHAAAATDVTDSVLRARRARPDVWLLTGYVPDTNLLLRTARSQGFRPAATMLTGTGDTQETLEAIGAERLAGTLVTAYPGPDISEDYGPGSDDYLEAYRERYGSDPRAPQSMTAYAGMKVLLQALEEAGSTDPAAVREAVMSMDEPEGTLPTGYGVKFDEKGQNTRAKPVVVQWRAGGEKVTVFPEAAAGGESIELSR